MPQDMGRGIMAPRNNEDIDNGAVEMRRLGASAAAAITDVDRTLSADISDRIERTEAYAYLLPKTEAAQYGIPGPAGKDGGQGPPGLPAAGAVPEDEAVAGFVAAEHSGTGAELRRIFAERAYTAVASSQTVHYWVSPTGDDTNDGSQDYPFATLAHVVGLLPDVIRDGHEYIITLMTGHWDERLELPPMVILGRLVVEGSTPDRHNHTILDAYTKNVVGHYTIRNIHSSKTEPGVHFRYEASGPRMEVINCSGSGEVTDEPHSSGNQGVLADYGSTVIVEDSQFDYKDYALRANYGSTIVSRNNTGTGNTHGVGVRFGGTVHLYGTIPHGYDSTTTFSSGGTIVHDSGGHVGVQRYNEQLEKHDTFGLIQQHTLQGQGSITPTKRWVSRMSSTTSGEISEDTNVIPSGSTLRTYFQMTTAISCPLSVDVTAAWVGIGSSARRFIKAFFMPYILAGEARATDIYVHADNTGGTPANVLRIGHTGVDGVFYLDFTPPTGANSGWHGLNIEISNMRHYDAPIMLGTEVVP